MKRKRRFHLRKKEFPGPTLVLFLPLYFSFLGDSLRYFFGFLSVTVLSLTLWYFFGPDLKDERMLSVQNGKLVDPNDVSDIALHNLRWSIDLSLKQRRLYEDRDHRNRILAAVLALLLFSTGALAYFDRSCNLRRANILIALCALGLLALAISALIRRLRRREERDRAAYPSPQVNMTCDYDAAADGRVRALQQRLERLEDWKKSGLIGEEEYEQLRKKYLKR